VTRAQWESPGTRRVKTFEKETGAKVKFEPKSFEQIRSTASQVLNSDAAPDILEYNKGNATAGLLSSQGLLVNLDSAVKTYGWDKKLAPSLQTTAKYDAKGIMGSGHWFGVPNYGEYVEVFYNKDMFAKQNIAIPTTQDEFVAAMQKFKDAGITPLAESAAEYPLGQLWYQLALTKADRAFVNNYQLYKGKVDWQGPELSYANHDHQGLGRQGLHQQERHRCQSRGRRRQLHQRQVPDLLLRQLVVQPVHHGGQDLQVGHVPVPGSTDVARFSRKHVGGPGESQEQGPGVQVHGHHHAPGESGPLG